MLFLIKFEVKKTYLTKFEFLLHCELIFPVRNFTTFEHGSNKESDIARDKVSEQEIMNKTFYSKCIGVFQCCKLIFSDRNCNNLLEFSVTT